MVLQTIELIWTIDLVLDQVRHHRTLIHLDYISYD